MRLLVLLFAGCAAAAPPEILIPPANDPLAFGEKPFRIESLPGNPPLRWPIDVVFSQGAWLLPWRDASGWHLRAVRLDGVSDVELDAEPRGICALDDGFAVAHEGSIDLGGRRIPTGLDGPIACAGRSVLMVEAHSAALVSSDGQRRLELPDPVSSLWGDREGFVAGDWLLSPDGDLARAPAPIVPGARLYRQSEPRGDRLSLDGLSWVETGGTLTWAQGTSAVIDGRVVLGLDGRLRGLIPRSVLGSSSWLTAKIGPDLVWEGVVGDDRALVLLDGGSLVATGGWVRVPAPMSRTILVVPGEAAALVAWLGSEGHVRFAVWIPEIR